MKKTEPYPCPQCAEPVKDIKYQGKKKTTHLLAHDTKLCRALTKIGEAIYGRAS